MKKVVLFCLLVCVTFMANAQDLPYSKYINYTKQEFKDNRFKYDKYTNTWALRKTSKLNATLNVLSILVDAEEEVRPDVNDYYIVVQLGKESKVSYVMVEFYNDDTYHKLLTFLKENGNNIIETSSGNIVKYQATYKEYALELNNEHHNITRTSARTIDYKTVKNVDESYNEYEFIIRTGIEPSSDYLDKQAAKQAKRDAKGKKKKSVDELM